MRIVLDENLPRPMLRFFGPEHQVATVQGLGLAGTRNGALLAVLEGNHDVFVTADKNIRYQQNLANRSLAIIELPTNRLPILTRFNLKSKLPSLRLLLVLTRLLPNPSRP